MAVAVEKVLNARHYLLFLPLSALGLGAIANFFAYWFSLDAWRGYPISFTIITVVVLAGLAFNQISWFVLPRMRKPATVKATAGWRVGVVTTFVPGAESLQMLEDTVSALVSMEYPHDTWVLDEGDDNRVQVLCQQLGALHFSRKGIHRYQARSGTFESNTKHGNVNAWLYEIGFHRYDIISSFDPDHVPEPEFLNRLLGYFEDPKVGYVQAAQAYYNQKASFIARGAAEETYGYYSSIQMASFSMGYPIVTGCHNTHRVIALKQVGGFAPHDADDLLITLFYLTREWRGIYVPEILARGLTPVDWEGYLKQQLRWARSVLDIKFRVFPQLADKLPLATRCISFLHGLSYVQETVVTVLGLLLITYILATGSTPVLSYLIGPELLAMYTILFGIEFFRQRFFLDPKERGIPWRAVLLRYAKWPQILRALVEVLFNRKVPYTLTLKRRSRKQRRFLLWPHLLVSIIIGSVWLASMARGTIQYPSLHVWAVLLIVVSLTLVATELRRFPDPYDRALRFQTRESGSAATSSVDVRPV